MFICIKPINLLNCFILYFCTAMENWGLVIYPIERILFNSSSNLASRELDVTNAISHEFSHQFFGNLVSPKWWSYLWLNEGFATLFRNLAADLVSSWDYQFDFELCLNVEIKFK